VPEERAPEDRRPDGQSGKVILYVPDLAEYEAKRGFYMDIREIPGIIVKSEEKLADAIRQEDAGKDAGGEKKTPETFLDMYMSACDGHSTARIADRIVKERNL